MSQLHKDTHHALVSLHGCVAMGTPFGRFKSDRGRQKTITDLAAIEYYLRHPKFKVIQKSEDGNTLANSEEDRSPPKVEPVKVSKLKVQGDGWGPSELQDASAEEERAAQEAKVADIEAQWLSEEAEAKAAEDASNKALIDSAESKDTASADTPEGVHAEVFAEQWSAKMGAPRLQKIYEERTGEKLDSQLGKKELLGMLNSLDQAEEQGE